MWRPRKRKRVFSAGDGQSEVSLSQSSVPPSYTVLAGSSNSSLGLVTSYAPTGSVATVLAGSSSSSTIGLITSVYPDYFSDLLTCLCLLSSMSTYLCVHPHTGHYIYC